MEPIRIAHFSDILCVWAYLSQVRYDEITSEYAGRVAMEYRYIHVFGAVATKIEAGWAKRGGMQGYAAHVRGVIEGFDHVTLHPDVWLVDTPQSSMPGHLLLCGVRRLEESGEVPAGTQAKVAWAVRQAFFTECADVSDQRTLLEIAERNGVPAAALERQLDRGAAHAALCEDLDQARQYSVSSSPTLLLNEGRQRLVGNVGYRILEANVREILERPGVQHSWC